jgi:hypothetical protein
MQRKSSFPGTDCVTMAVAASACAYAAQTKVCGYNILRHQCKIFNCDTVWQAGIHSRSLYIHFLCLRTSVCRHAGLGPASSDFGLLRCLPTVSRFLPDGLKTYTSFSSLPCQLSFMRASKVVIVWGEAQSLGPSTLYLRTPFLSIIYVSGTPVMPKILAADSSGLRKTGKE